MARRALPGNKIVLATTNTTRYDERELRLFAEKLGIPASKDMELSNLKIAINQKQHQILHEGVGVNMKPDPGE